MKSQRTFMVLPIFTLVLPTAIAHTLTATTEHDF